MPKENDVLYRVRLEFGAVLVRAGVVDANSPFTADG